MFPKKRRKSLPSEPVEYPVGSFIETEAGYFYIATTSKRYRFLSKRGLDSWHPHRVILSSEDALSKYRIAAKMKFRNGSLIHNLADGKIYLISEGKRRHITNPDVFERIGAVRKDVTSVSLEEIKLHELGASLD